ncbi:MAG: hypothetical protein ICV79_22610 [Flavisolibacter sp.]|nr:hypothetical protein [Flavisolibacter sp.]
MQKMVKEGKPGAHKLYDGLLKEIESKPELLQPIKETTVLHPHAELVETLLSTIFPPSASVHQGIYAISIPFRSEVIYASPGFKELLVKEGSNVISIPDAETNLNISKAYLNLAFNVIQRQFYAMDMPVIASSVHPFPNPETGLTRYFDFKLNAQFIEVKCINDQYTLPDSFSPPRSLDTEELKEIFPLENFQFEGLVVIEVTEVTTDQVIAEIKNSLLSFNSSSDVTVYGELQLHVQTLIELNDVNVGITPFFKMNNYYLFSEVHNKNSILYKNPQVVNNKDQVLEHCLQTFKNADQPLLFQTLNAQNIGNNQLLKYYYDLDVRSLVLCPLKCDDGDLIGLLEITSDKPGHLEFKHLSKLQPAIQLFILALEKNNEHLELQVDKIIKNHFTAIQSAVEWKFTEAAFNYLKNKQVYDAAKMQPIVFDNVYPLYGAIDIRNSSIERTNAIQLDLAEQLNLARGILGKASKAIHLPLLKEIQFRIDKYLSATSDSLLSDDEMLIYDFLQIDMEALFRHLKTAKPELKRIIDEYYAALDPQRQIIYHHRKDYEESINRINDTLDKFIDNEQQAAQQVYPHYFERYITDGIEFNVYVGQSLAPQHPFDEIYVKNLKLWQLTLLAKAAKLTHALEKKLSLPLQTTQLILAHSIPLTISFRRKERKFDVEGAYNIRYEIIKKRIDKVHLKDSDERLTQPGKVAIVYSQQRELHEYLEYIDFLQNEKLLTGEVEHLELEDTQGISGLRAIRVDVQMGTEVTPSNVELSKITSQQLLRK